MKALVLVQLLHGIEGYFVGSRSFFGGHRGQYSSPLISTSFSSSSSSPSFACHNSIDQVSPRISVVTTEREYSKRCKLDHVPDFDVQNHHDLVLRRCPSTSILQLVWGGAADTPLRRQKPFFIDFNSQEFQRRGRYSKSELIVKAMGKNPKLEKSIWDLTAGLGRDAFILASAGFRVQMFERNCVLHSLLQDAIERLKDNNKNLAERLVLNSLTDSTSVMNDVDSFPDYVYLDPMYPSESVGRKSNVRKNTQMLRKLVEYEEEEDGDANNLALFNTAHSIALSRVVVKRPLTATPLCDNKPTLSIQGSGQRFDVYMVPLSRL